VEDAELRDEVPGSKLGATHNEYDFWSHAKTYNYHASANILEIWRNVTRKATNNDGIIIITGNNYSLVNMKQFYVFCKFKIQIYES